MKVGGTCVGVRWWELGGGKRDQHIVHICLAIKAHTLINKHKIDHLLFCYTTTDQDYINFLE